jgi:ABC-2 type transport system ATP-binding protein
MTATSGLAIDARGVEVTYGDGTEAVRGVDLQIPEGEFFGFLGANGAGKTTTIKTLVTLLTPTAGSVTVNGYDTLTEGRSVRQSVGYMAQEMQSTPTSPPARTSSSPARRTVSPAANARNESTACSTWSTSPTLLTRPRTASPAG